MVDRSTAVHDAIESQIAAIERATARISALAEEWEDGEYGGSTDGEKRGD